jgi:hypothetical protein
MFAFSYYNTSSIAITIRSLFINPWPIVIFPFFGSQKKHTPEPRLLDPNDPVQQARGHLLPPFFWRTLAVF